MLNRRTYLAAASSLGASTILIQTITPAKQQNTSRQLESSTAWNFERHPNNPIIDGASPNGSQAYPPSVILVNGRYFATVKSYPNVVGFESEDGVTWTERSPRLISRSDFDDYIQKVTAPHLTHDPQTNTTHLYYSFETGDARHIGHSAHSPIRQYKPSFDPILSPSDFPEQLGVDARYISIGDVIRVGEEYIYYGEAGGDTWKIWMGKGDRHGEISLDRVLFTAADVPMLGGIVHTPNVIKTDSGYIMTVTHGKQGKVADERRIIAARGETYDSFEPTDEVVLTVGPNGSWEDRRVYAAKWLVEQDGTYLTPKKIDGSYRLYYSGHALNDGDGEENLGLTGLATYDSIP